MAYANPFEMYMQAAEAKNRNRQQMNQDIAGLGQGLGTGFNTIGEAMKAAKQKQMIEQFVNDPSLKGDPTIGPLLPLMKAYPEMVGQWIPAIIRARGITGKHNQGASNLIVDQGPSGYPTPVPQAQGPVTQTGEPVLPPPAPGVVRGPIKFENYVKAMATKTKNEEAERKFETIVKQKTDATMGPINDAESTTNQMIEAYQKMIDAKEAGPIKGRAGGFVASVTGGKKKPEIFKYQRTKNALISTLFKGIGVNRFTMGEVQNLINSLPSGGEDPARGMEILQSFKKNLLLRKQAAEQQLQSELAVYRGIMMPGGGTPTPDVNVSVSGEAPDASAFEEP